ncbi:MAG: O-antigen ligase family protein [Saprospiraceae bacterium]|nr:O-antigen ligase family protein [Saprospiraceae bacterium]
MLLNDKQQQQGLFLTLLLFAFFMPLFPRVATYIGALGILICLLNPKIYLRLKRRNILEILAFSTPLLVWIPALILGHSVGAKVETKVSLLLLPLVFYLIDQDIAAKSIQLFKSYFLGLCAAGLYCIGGATVSYFFHGSNNFFYSKLGSYIHIHPTYFSLYLIIAISFFMIAIRKNQLNQIERRIGWLATVFFSILIVLLSSRSQWVNYVLIVPVLLFPLLQDRIGSVKAAVLFIFAGLFFAFSVYMIPATNKRLMDLFSLNDTTEKVQVQNVRYQTWDASLELFKASPLVGVGVQNLQGEQLLMYEQLNYERPLREKYNAHNQYLDLLAGAGLIPLIFWLVCLFWQRPVNRNLQAYYFTALILFLLSFLTESMLETARGVMLFSFIMGLLMVSMKRKPYAI